MNSSHPCRRHALRLLASAAGAALLPAAWAQKRPESTAVELWKDASCGCCEDWITHMKQHGFTVTAHDTGNNAVRARLGLAQKYGSCHTALVGGYVVEGHVHADDVRRLLRENRWRWGWPCRACRSARPAWMARCTAAGATNTTRCWCCATAAAGCFAPILEARSKTENRTRRTQRVREGRERTAKEIFF